MRIPVFSARWCRADRWRGIDGGTDVTCGRHRVAVGGSGVSLSVVLQRVSSGHQTGVVLGRVVCDQRGVLGVDGND